MALPLQKSPEVPQSGTHHHPLPLTPAPAQPTPSNSPHRHSDRFFFSFEWGYRHIDSIPSFPGVTGSHAGQRWPLLPFGVLITSSSSPQGSTQNVWHLFGGRLRMGGLWWTLLLQLTHWFDITDRLVKMFFPNYCCQISEPPFVPPVNSITIHLPGHHHLNDYCNISST